MTSLLSMIVKWNTHQICLDIAWQECMSSFLSFIFVIRICDFAAKEACNVVEKWKWNCVGYVQCRLTEWQKLEHACRCGKWTTGLSQQDPGTDICQNNFPQHIKMFLSLLCYSDVFGNCVLKMVTVRESLPSTYKRYWEKSSYLSYSSMSLFHFVCT